MNTFQEQIPDSGTESSSARLVGQFRDIEMTLNRIEYATTHYDVLGIDIDSSGEEISCSFEQAAGLLQPSYRKANINLPNPAIARIDRAIERVRHAFNVLSDSRKRIEYDHYLYSYMDAPVSTKLPPVQGHDNPILSPSLSSSVAQSCEWLEAADSVNPFAVQAERFSEFTCDQESENRRKFERLNLSIPAYVTGHDRPAGEWHEMTHTLDVSRIGARIRLRKRARYRSLLHLALPLPMRLRCHRHCEPSYSIYALVRRVEPPRDGARVVAVEFVGEHPPAGYIEKPWATYATKWSGVERRRSPRQEISEVVYIEYLDDQMRRIRQEAGVAEDASSRGMRVFVKSAPPDFELLKVTSPGRSFESLAVVCNRYVGKDHLERLCLQFAQAS